MRPSFFTSRWTSSPSRLRAEILSNEQGPKTAAFLTRTVLSSAQGGIAIRRVLSDNGGNYRSFPFQGMANEHSITLKKTRPLPSQTNGEVEAVNWTLQREWTYLRPSRPNTEHQVGPQPFVGDYDYAHPHTAIGNQPPASRR